MFIASGAGGQPHLNRSLDKANLLLLEINDTISGGPINRHLSICYVKSPKKWEKFMHSTELVLVVESCTEAKRGLHLPIWQLGKGTCLPFSAKQGEILPAPGT